MLLQRREVDIDDVDEGGGADAPDEEDLGTPEERELVRRVREDRARSGVRARTVGLAVAALAVLIAALVLTPRPAHEPDVATDPRADVDAVPATSSTAGADDTRSVPPADDRQPVGPADDKRPVGPADDKQPARPVEVAAAPAPTVPAPAVARPQERAEEPPARSETPTRSETSVELPPRAGPPRAVPSRVAASEPRTDARPPRRPWQEPAALPSAVSRQARLDVRAQVDRTISTVVEGGIDYRVRVSHPGGEPVSDADVRVRGLTTDGVLVEARLDRGDTPGLYRGLIRFTPRGPRHLTLLISRAESVTEIPIGDGARPSGAPDRR